MKSQLGEKPLAACIFALCAVTFAYRLYLSAAAWRAYVLNGIANPALVIDTAHAVCALFLLAAAAFHLFIKSRRTHRNAVAASFVMLCLCYLIYLLLNLVALWAFSGFGHRWTEFVAPSLSLLVSSLLSPVPILFTLLWASVRSARRSPPAADDVPAAASPSDGL